MTQNCSECMSSPSHICHQCASILCTSHSESHSNSKHDLLEIPPQLDSQKQWLKEYLLKQFESRMQLLQNSKEDIQHWQTAFDLSHAANGKPEEPTYHSKVYAEGTSLLTAKLNSTTQCINESQNLIETLCTQISTMQSSDLTRIYQEITDLYSKMNQEYRKDVVSLLNHKDIPIPFQFYKKTAKSVIPPSVVPILPFSKPITFAGLRLDVTTQIFTLFFQIYEKEQSIQFFFPYQCPSCHIGFQLVITDQQMNKNRKSVNLKVNAVCAHMWRWSASRTQQWVMKFKSGEVEGNIPIPYEFKRY